MSDKKKEGYANIKSSTSRQIVEDSSVMKLNEERPEGKEIVQPITAFKPMEINIKSVHLNMNPVLLQNPHMQIYSSFTNYSVCPFCKYSGAMKIDYITSGKQKQCCCLMALGVAKSL